MKNKLRTHKLTGTLAPRKQSAWVLVYHSILLRWFKWQWTLPWSIGCGQVKSLKAPPLSPCNHPRVYSRVGSQRWDCCSGDLWPVFYVLHSKLLQMLCVLLHCQQWVTSTTHVLTLTTTPCARKMTAHESINNLYIMSTCHTLSMQSIIAQMKFTFQGK